MAAKGLDTGDRVLAHAMAQRMIHAVRQQERRGQLQDGWKVKGASRLWKKSDFVRSSTLDARTILNP